MTVAPVTFQPDRQLYRFEVLDQYRKLVHGISTRHSLGAADFNLSFHTGNEDLVHQNRALLQHYFQASSLTIPRQCHGVAVVRITENNNREIPADTDALITNVPGLAIGVLSADCVPLLFFDPVQQALGAAHAGWKGTVANIGAATVKSMQDAFGSRPEDLVACIGPSISQPHFEVGEEVADRFRQLELESCIVQKAGEKPHVDLWRANHLLLQREGLLASQLHCAGICTVENTGHFYSARAEGFNTGRFGAFLMLQ